MRDCLISKGRTVISCSFHRASAASQTHKYLLSGVFTMRFWSLKTTFCGLTSGRIGWYWLRIEA